MFPGPLGVASQAGRCARGSGRARRSRSATSRPTSTARSTTRRRAAGRGWCCGPTCSRAAHRQRRADGRPVLAMTPRGRAAHPGARARARGGPGRHHPVRPVRGLRRAPVRGARDRGGVDRRLRPVGRRDGGAGAARRLHSAASRRNGRALPAGTRRASKAACSNIRIIPDLTNGKGARSPKCCDRGIMRGSRPGASRRPRPIHG